jgi:subtilisin family serine protease
MSGDVSARSGRRMAVASVLVLTVGLLVASAPSAFPSSRVSSKIDPRVAQQVQAQGAANFWVLFRAKANLSKAPAIKDWTARGWFVVNALKNTANSSQRGFRSYLTQQHADYQAFWIVNGIRVAGGSQRILNAAAARPEVWRIMADRGAHVSPYSVGTRIPAGIDGFEWNIKNIQANKVQKQLGIKGAGSVVANIDTGVQFDHPALVKSYRGNLGGGTFNHNFNWWDPSHVCPQPKPCDNVDHGTHTMGTMVGKAGVNKIGVAPAAKWIAAKGCESNSCSLAALASSGQFMLAPTDLNGNNPDPSKRPDVINNSWSGGGGDNFYQSIVTAWVSSGIFPQFANGNSGPSCSSSGSPGDYQNSYSAGAYDINNNIASFSSRGPSAFGGEIKPNIAAPGVNVRSSVPTNTYAVFSGTSMASPHVAGTVALIISKNNALRGNIAQLRTLLDNSGTDVNSLGCGGNLDDNNNFGEGRLNALNAVQNAFLAGKQG